MPDIATLPRIDGEMNWSGPIEGRARVDVADWSRTNMALEKHACTLYDARAIRDRLSLDKQGFALFDHTGPSADPDWLKEMPQAYTDSVGAFLKEMSGASMVLAQGTGMLVRHAESAKKQGAIGPSRWVHMDYTKKWADVWVDWIEEWNDAKLRHYPRFCIFQTWRNLTPPPVDNTLVFCDASTLDPDDCIVFDACMREPFESPGNQFESQFSRYNEQQRWYYFSDLTADELIVFKGHDSDDARYAQPMHNSIDFPPVEGAMPRISVEARFFAFFE